MRQQVRFLPGAPSRNSLGPVEVGLLPGGETDRDSLLTRWVACEVRLVWIGQETRRSPAALLDPAVLQGRDLLACLAVDVEHGEDHHDRPVLPLREVAGLTGDPL